MNIMEFSFAANLIINIFTAVIFLLALLAAFFLLGFLCGAGFSDDDFFGGTKPRKLRRKKARKIKAKIKS